MPEVITLTAAFADAGKNGVAAVLVSYVADKLHDKHGLADACAAEQADLAALGVRREQVNDLDAGFEYFGGWGNIRKRRCLPVNGHILFGVYRTLTVDRLADDIEHAAERCLADRHFNGCSRIDRRAAAGQSVGRKQRDASYTVISDVLNSLHDDLMVIEVYLYSIIDIRQLAGGKLDVNNGAYDPSDYSVFH